MSWELVSFVNRSKNRKQILISLDKPVTPTALAKNINMHRSTVSRALISLEKRGLAVCLNPESKKERYYQITSKGKKILRDIEKLNTA